MKKDIMRGLWLAYIAGDEKAFDRVSLRAFREPEKETKKKRKQKLKKMYTLLKRWIFAAKNKKEKSYD